MLISLLNILKTMVWSMGLEKDFRDKSGKLWGQFWTCCVGSPTEFRMSAELGWDEGFAKWRGPHKIRITQNKIHDFRILSESAWLDIRMPLEHGFSCKHFPCSVALDLVSARTAWRTSPPAFLSKTGRHVSWMFSLRDKSSKTTSQW